ncbi:hypothetical protein L208DRAFT_1316500, partial [Tricholoma matsutake]
GAASPDEICRRILDPNSDFHKSLVQYLESVHAGEFMQGSKEGVEVQFDTASNCTDYQDPMQTMAEPPPPACLKSSCSSCENCTRCVSDWHHMVDDLLLGSNVHKCTSNKNKDRSQNKAHPFKGCLDNIWGQMYRESRFPRPTFKQTEIDEETGRINFKKREPWLNTFPYLLTYLFWCNMHITSLRSGMAIKGVLLYVSNYVTKLLLKTHVIFNTVCAIFQKNSEMIGGSDTRKEKAHKLMTKIVNSLSTKINPMICMYLLHLPDHYKSHKFPLLYWQLFVQEC